MANEIHVAFAVDRGYFDQVAVTIASIVANASDPSALRFHILHDEDESWVSQAMDRWSVPRPNAVRLANPFATYNAAPGSTWTTAALLRLLLPTVLPDVERVLYLDADIVVLHDIAELWRTDLGHASIGGVIDTGIALFVGRGEVYRSYAMRDHLLSLGLDPLNFTYVNAGFLLMDLEKLRRRDFTRRALEMDVSRRDTLLFLDQDIINSMLRDEIVQIDPRWNVHAQVMGRSFRRRHHYIFDNLQGLIALQDTEQWAIHYAGPKPWRSTDVWRKEEWWRYAPLSGIDWPRPAETKRSFSANMREGWLDLTTGFSAFRHKLRKARSGTTLRRGS